MFKIGDFAKLGRVSIRQLRHYDAIGLLSPTKVDLITGYRYYAAEQLGRLNRLLALKALGLSLDQIGRLFDNNISSQEIMGMFLLRKAELEQSLNEEARRLRNVELRLKLLDQNCEAEAYDVVLKSADAQPYLAFRGSFETFSDAVMIVKEVVRSGMRRIPDRVRSSLVVVGHSEFDEEDIDLEIGFALLDDWSKPISLPGNVELTRNDLPRVECLASLVRNGPVSDSHLGFGALAAWMEDNRYEITGPCREVFLRPPFERPDSDDATIEIQFPVRQIG